MSIDLRPVSSGPLHILPTIAAPNTKVTVTVQNLRMGTKVALAAALYGATYVNYDVSAKDPTRPVGQEHGTQDRTNLLEAQKVFYGMKHMDRVYRTAFSQRDPVHGLQNGSTGNPPISFVMPFANAVQYYKLDAELYRLVQGGALAVISAVAS